MKSFQTKFKPFQTKFISMKSFQTKFKPFQTKFKSFQTKFKSFQTKFKPFQTKFISKNQNIQKRLFSNSKSTIYALSSGLPVGGCGVSIFRISGPEACKTLKALTGKDAPEPRKCALRNIFNLQGEKIDSGLVVFFPAPHSFTGEDVVELHLHGSRAVARETLDLLGELGLSPSEPGEFTKRAFQNEKMDLTRVEGLGDLIKSETKAQRRYALTQMEGGLNQLYSKWRAQLKRNLAHLEAWLDFGEDERLEGNVFDRVVTDAELLQKEISGYLIQSRRGERLRDGVRISLLGEPNAGKSSLFNILARREAAIVSPTPGTTRDVLEVHLDFGGWPALLSDTAGVRESPQMDPIETEGIRRSLERSSISDIVLLVLDATQSKTHNQNVAKLLTRPFSSNPEVEICIALNKVDLVSPSLELQNSFFPHAPIWNISCKTQTGIPALENGLETLIKHWFESGHSSLMITHARHIKLLREVQDDLNRFHKSVLSNDIVIAAEELRFAMNNLGRLTGRVDVEELLDIIFSDFCIGK